MGILNMKIPLDFFLIMIKKFLDEADLKDVSKVLKKHLEISMDDYDELVKNKEEFCLKKIIKFFLSQNKPLRKDITKLRKHIESLEQESSEEEEKPTKKRKMSKESMTKGKSKRKSSTNSYKNLGKKTSRKNSSRKNSKISDYEPEFKFQMKKPLNPQKNVTNVPFKRINDNIIDGMDENFIDNTYDGFMAKSGNAYGREANDKLKIVKGKDFKKEKTKFKNKTTFSSNNISTDIKSIKLEYDSE